jgi:hypothetical protein
MDPTLFTRSRYGSILLWIFLLATITAVPFAFSFAGVRLVGGPATHQRELDARLSLFLTTRQHAGDAAASTNTISSLDKLTVKELKQIVQENAGLLHQSVLLSFSKLKRKQDILDFLKEYLPFNSIGIVDSATPTHAAAPPEILYWPAFPKLCSTNSWSEALRSCYPFSRHVINTFYMAKMPF